MTCAHHKKQPKYQPVGPGHIQLTHYVCPECQQAIPNPYFRRRKTYRPSPLPGLIILALLALIIAYWMLT